MTSHPDIPEEERNVSLWKMLGCIYVVYIRQAAVEWAIERGDPYIVDEFHRERSLLALEQENMHNVYRNQVAKADLKRTGRIQAVRSQ